MIVEPTDVGGAEPLADVLVEMVRSLVTTVDTPAMLQTLTTRTAQLLDAQAVGILFADEQGRLGVAAASTPDAAELDGLQLEHGDGICLHAYETGESVVATGPEQMRRWPAWSARATGLGYRSAVAAPLRFVGTPIGALNVLHRAEHATTDRELRVLQTLADVATIVVMTERRQGELERTAQQLQAALDSRVVIEQAKGIVAERAGRTPDDAFRLIRAHARNENRRLQDVAHDIVAGTLRLR